MRERRGGGGGGDPSAAQFKKRPIDVKVGLRLQPKVSEKSLIPGYFAPRDFIYQLDPRYSKII